MDGLSPSAAGGRVVQAAVWRSRRTRAEGLPPGRSALPCFSTCPFFLVVPQSVTDKLKEKLSGDEKDKVEKAVQAALDWMDENQVC